MRSKRWKAQQRKIVAGVGRDASKTLKSQLKSDTGGDRRLSGLGEYGRPQTVVVKTHVAGRTVEAYVLGGPRSQRAPWFWLEFGTKPGPRPWRSRNRGGTRFGQVALSASRGLMHAGTPAKRTWSKGIRAADPKVRVELKRKIDDAIAGD